MQYFTALVGARTAYSSGTGTVAEYRAAAQAAGYRAVFFTETLADITKDEWTRFVQDCDAQGQAVGELRPDQPLGAVRGDLDALQLAFQLAAGHHFGQHHGDDLQVLDLVVGIDPLCAVLDHQHADRPAAAQQRHAHEGVERIFAGLRPIGEGRMVGGVRQVERPAQAHDLADQALAGLHAGDVDGAGVEAFGGEQFHVAAGAAHVEGANFGHHRAGDDPHNDVEARLSRPARGERFANLPQQTALSPNSDPRHGHQASFSPFS